MRTSDESDRCACGAALAHVAGAGVSAVLSPSCDRDSLDELGEPDLTGELSVSIDLAQLDKEAARYRRSVESRRAPTGRWQARWPRRPRARAHWRWRPRRVASESAANEAAGQARAAESWGSSVKRPPPGYLSAENRVEPGEH